MPLSVGDVFVGYTVVRQIGAGGMGVVYLVRHPRLRKQNALKVLPDQTSADSSFRRRFIREADLAAELFHEHIVGVHDRGEQDGLLWILMDFVDGADAAELLATQYPAGLPTEDVVAIVAAMASALDYAHGKGLLHRDVKPANIMLTEPDDSGRRRILLADFGIARPLDTVNVMTSTGMTFGTLAYSAPEQLMEQTLDGRVDQYALAATAYQLLTGQLLFPHANPAAVIGHHLSTQPPAVSAIVPALRALDPVLATALAKDPADRYPSCSDFARAFSRAAAETNRPTDDRATTRPGVAASAPTVKRGTPRNSTPENLTIGTRARLAVAACAIVLIAVLGVVIALAVPSDESALPPTATTPATTIWTTPSSSPQPSSVTAAPPIATTAEPVQPFSLPGCYRGADDPDLGERPTVSPSLCRHRFYEGLTWTSWGPAGAEGAGTEQRQNCNPTCAQGEIFRNPVVLVFTGSQQAPLDSGCPTTHLYYSQLIVAYPNFDELPSGLSFSGSSSYATDTRYNGMPAIRYNELAIMCNYR